MKRKFLSFLLALSILVGTAIPIQASATPAEPEADAIANAAESALDALALPDGEPDALAGNEAGENDPEIILDEADPEIISDENDPEIIPDEADPEIIPDEADPEIISDEAVDTAAENESAVDMDVSSLSPDEYASWKAGLADSELSFPSGAEGVFGRYIRNDYLEAYISSNGQFTMGTTGGDPENANDDNAWLLYYHRDPWSSNTMVRIDGADYWFHNYITDVDFDQDGLRCVASADIQGVIVRQILQFETNPYTSHQDIISIRYETLNATSAAKQIGVRIMLDTMLANNDGAPFRVKGQAVTEGREFIGANVPEYWQAFDNLSNPSIVSTGYFFKSSDEKPDKVQFTDWPSIFQAPWEHSIDESKPLTGDSAVAAYFNPRTVNPNNSRSVVTYYGVSAFAADDLDGTMAVRVTAPDKLDTDDQGGYVPNPYRVTAYIENTGLSALTAISAKIDLSGTNAALVLSDASPAIVRWDSLDAGGTVSANWDIRAIAQDTAVTLTYPLHIEAMYNGQLIEKTINLTLTLEPVVDSLYKTVTFDENYSGGPTSNVDVRTGALVPKPADPVRTGYLFRGWYANQKCNGTAWYNASNSDNGSAVTHNITLYAKWEAGDTKSVRYGIDTFNFTNSSSNFTSTYQITGEYWNYLLADLSNSYSQNIIRQAQSQWGGSCFGMSSVLSLAKASSSLVDPKFFQASANRLYDLKTPRESAPVKNLINFYQLIQFTPQAQRGLNSLSANAVTRHRALVDAVQTSRYPVVICINVYQNNVRQFGHALVAYGLQSRSANQPYLVDVWDPNDKTSPLTLTISNDFTSAKFNRVYDVAPRRSELFSVLTVEESGNTYDYKNIQAHLQSRGLPSVNASGLAQNDIEANAASLLITNYANFTITLLDENDQPVSQATVENLEKIDGDLDIQFFGLRNEMEQEREAEYIAPNLPAGHYYKIVPSPTELSVVTENPLAEYFTGLENDDSQFGFWASVTAEQSGTVIIRDDGGISTQFDGVVPQTLQATLNDTPNTWDTITAQGGDTAFTLDPSGSGGVNISTENLNAIEITAGNAFNQVSFPDVIPEADGVTVTEEEGSRLVTLAGSVEPIASQTLGYAAVFHSLGGDPIDVAINITPGATITPPPVPTRAAYNFSGWFKDENFLSPWNFNTDAINEDTHLYALWNFDVDFYHTVTFRAANADDAIFVLEDGSAIPDEDLPGLPRRRGYLRSWDIQDFSAVTMDTIVNAIYEETDIVYGDADADGSLNMLDVIKVLRRVAGYSVDFTPVQWEASHTTESDDYDLSMNDVIRLLRHVAGYNVTLGPNE
ncbi:MAG: InlB B-repeat-containing protein [Clostridiales bacterium]|jgi:uncharacterized repeat protein (TIGR02543 family)|nr:InlB B-repeat-containing protein [Clostridiales bacterium]